MHIVLFFTHGVSLKHWQRAGIIEREAAAYKTLAKRGHEVTFFTYGDNDDCSFQDILDGIKIVPAYARCKRHKNRYIRFLYSFLFPFLFRDLFERADILKTNQMKGSWVPLIAKIIHRKKIVVRCGYELYRNQKRDSKACISDLLRIYFFFVLEAIAYHLADCIFISSETDRAFIMRIFKVPAAKIHIVRNVIDTELFSPAAGKPVSGDNDNSILYVGRLIERKNLITLIRAAEELGVGLGIAGTGDQQQFLEAEALKANGTIEFFGVIENSKLPQLIGRYPFFILPSFYENSPKTLLEAMACSRVVIGANVDGIRELISDGRNGFLCEPDVHSLVLCIKKVMGLSKEERTIIGSNARSFVIQECSLRSAYEREKSLYQ